MRYVFLLFLLVAPVFGEDVQPIIRRWVRSLELPTSPALRWLYPGQPRWLEAEMLGSPVRVDMRPVHEPPLLSPGYGDTRLEVLDQVAYNVTLRLTTPDAQQHSTVTLQFGKARSEEVTSWFLARVGPWSAPVQAPAPVTRRFETREFYPNRKGGPLVYHRFGTGANLTLLFSAIHGDERNTAPLLEKLVEHLDRNAEVYDGRTVVVMPVVSPEGWARKTRENGQGIDANRNFVFNFKPGKPRGSRPLQTPESQALSHFVQSYRPDKLVTVHCPYDLINYDGPAADLAEAMQASSRQGIAPSIGYPTPGSFGTFAGLVLGIPTITLELPETGDAWPVQKDALLQAIRF